jgi:glycosyltransferase involved in cell wall biosynthesis
MNSLRSNRVVLAANNGDIGGGEVMLLALAEELTGLGILVTVVCPCSPAGLMHEARARGFETVVLGASNRFEYARALRAWNRRNRVDTLWCNGLLPAVATSGHRNRIVHLHQRPHGKQHVLSAIATWGALKTLVPSISMSSAVRRSSVMYNWVAEVSPINHASSPHDPAASIRLGFLGRPSTEKGVEVLADALRLLEQESPGRFTLVLGGESRFVGEASRSSVEASLARLGSMVEQTGWIEPEDFFGRIDILVCPSVWPEAFGLVVAESMSARVPVVVSDSGALPEVVGPEHPWIAKAGDAADLARIVRRAGEGNRATVENSYLRWKSHFSPDAGRQRLRLLLADLKIPSHGEGKVSS